MPENVIQQTDSDISRPEPGSSNGLGRSNSVGGMVGQPRLPDYFSVPALSAAPNDRIGTIGTIDPLKPASPAFSTFIGLLFHAIADGISLGAASLVSGQPQGSSFTESATSGLSVVIFLSIIVHKAPVAFSLTTFFLLHAHGLSTRVHFTYMKRALIVFSLATPFGAILTWLLLKIISLASWSDSMDENAEEDGNIEGVLGGNMRGKLEFWSEFERFVST